MIFQSAKFYGAANLIINERLDKIYLSASWAHGVDEIFHSFHSCESYIHPQEYNLTRHLVANEKIQEYPGMSRFEVHAVGVPFLYTDPNIKEHHGSVFRRSYMPDHSIAGFSFSSQYKNWIDTAIENGCDSVILANSDYEAFTLLNKSDLPSNIQIIRGAKVTEPGTLIRLKSLFYSIRECLFDSAGSHIIYATLCGVRPIFIENKMGEIVRKDNLKKLLDNYPSTIRRRLKDYMFSRLSHKDLFNTWSKYALNELRDLAEFSAGVHCKKSKESLSELLMPRDWRENLSNMSRLVVGKTRYKLSF